MIIRNHIMKTTMGTLLVALSLSAQSLVTLPSDSVSFGLFVVAFQTKVFEEGVLLNYPTCLEVDTVSLPLELEVQPAADFGYTIMTYPCTGDTVFHGSYVWMGMGQIYKPNSFIPADSFYVQEDSIPQPASAQYWQEDGMPLQEPSEIQAADSVWSAIQNLHLVSQFARYPYQAVIYLYHPSWAPLEPSTSKWIVFLYRNPTAPLATYPGPAFSLTFNNSELEFPVVVDTHPRTYRMDAEVLDLIGENAPTEWTFSSIHQSENTLGFYFDDFVFGPGDTINWRDTTSYDMELMDTSDHITQTFMDPGDFSPPIFSDVNTGNPSAFILRTNNIPGQMTGEDTLSFSINGHARSDLTQFYPLALGHKWKWATSHHYIDSVRTEEVIAVSEMAEFTEYVIERRGHDYQQYGGLSSMDTISKYTRELDRANIYSAPSSEAVSVSFSDSNPEEEIEFVYQLIDDSPELFLRKGDEFSSTIWRYGVGLSSEFMDPGAVKNLIGFEINGVVWGDLDPILVSIHEHPALPANFSLQAYPNPFNPTATISYTLPRASDTKLTVYNISGQTVDVIVDSNLDAGTYKAHWNGLNQSGRPVSAGMYFIQLHAENHSQVVKVLYLK